MKNFLALFVLALFVISVSAQSPEKLSYQAVIRDATNNLVTSQAIGMQISLLQGSSIGTPVYVETQTPTTNPNGLVNVSIGDGIVQSGDFSTIDWADGPYFIKTETDPTGGTSYSITGTSQLLSVPYALHAKTAGTVTETDPRVPYGTQPGQIQYWNGSDWVTLEPGNEGGILTVVNGLPRWKVEPGEDDVENPATGKLWMNRNLGASEVATSSIDAEGFGDSYQWGRPADGHQIRTSGTTSVLSALDTPEHGSFIVVGSSPHDWRSSQNDNFWQGSGGINNPCPSGYRLPTEAEWQAERQSWNSNNAIGAYDSPLKLPAAGYRNNTNGALFSVNEVGNYWSSTVEGTNSRHLYFDVNGSDMYSNGRAFGFSVRCIKN